MATKIRLQRFGKKESLSSTKGEAKKAALAAEAKKNADRAAAIALKNAPVAEEVVEEEVVADEAPAAEAATEEVVAETPAVEEAPVAEAPAAEETKEEEQA